MCVSVAIWLLLSNQEEVAWFQMVLYSTLRRSLDLPRVPSGFADVELVVQVSSFRPTSYQIPILGHNFLLCQDGHEPCAIPVDRIMLSAACPMFQKILGMMPSDPDLFDCNCFRPRVRSAVISPCKPPRAGFSGWGEAWCSEGICWLGLPGCL